MSAVPEASSAHVRRRMQAQRTRDTAPELAVRSAAHRAGLRYRVDVRPVPDVKRKADLVFRSARVAVFIDGCFWHSCPQHGGQPRANSEWWRAKLDRTRRRDLDTTSQLQACGWTVLRFWEHEDPVVVAEQIARVVRGRAGPPLAFRPSL